MHRFFDKHADKVGKELLSLSRPSEADASAINGKKAWDGLCAALVELDSSVPPPQPSPLNSSSLEGYIEFMEAHSDADTSSVAHLFVDSTPPDVRFRLASMFFALTSLSERGGDCFYSVCHKDRSRYHQYGVIRVSCLQGWST